MADKDLIEITAAAQVFSRKLRERAELHLPRKAPAETATAGDMASLNASAALIVFADVIDAAAETLLEVDAK